MKPKPAIPVFRVCLLSIVRLGKGKVKVSRGSERKAFYAQLRKMWYTFVINRVYLILRRESFLEWYFTFSFPQIAYVYMENFFKWDKIQKKRKMRRME